MHLKTPFARCRQFCMGPNVLGLVIVYTRGLATLLFSCYNDRMWIMQGIVMGT